jgi:hypothetical protein
MLPRKEDNIYPKTRENLMALFHYYFDQYDEIVEYEKAINMALEKTSMTLNQFEFLVKHIGESWPILFKDFLRNGGNTVSNLLRYGIDALTKEEKDWSFGPYSSGRPKVREFREYVEGKVK